MASSVAYVRTEPAATLPPPIRVGGVVGWIRENLFSGLGNTVLTLLALYVIWVTVPPIIEFLFVDAVWEGSDREACVGPNVGACWAFVEARFPQYIYGRYPIEERWRVDIVFALLAIGLIPMAIPRAPFKRANAVFLLVVLPVVSLILLNGGDFDVWLSWWIMLAVGLAIAEAIVFLPALLGAVPFSDRLRPALVAMVPFAVLAAVFVVLSIDFGLMEVETALWGGLLVTLVVALCGIAASLPIGILLALGRRSDLPLVRLFSVIFIEFWRGVPLITILFMSSVMLPLFLPDDVSFDKLLRALIGVAMFASAYMAEVVRGGLQAMPKGQYEGADALGLGHWQKMQLIILPQALKHVIPGIVNTFIGLFKDTSLILIVGLFDLLGMVKLSLVDPKWASPVTPATGYIFAGFVFWLFCFGMSRYSIFIERRLDRSGR
ncbi:amino acid ABC transporter permease [Amorphus orientalis]|uniref:General L-amino acid transport system permease protein n=1 Tax=Amorphus orientalis TaxID=649198 RepID=A0AAE3VQ93_9HYPH|nr:amino acid ABC transporter permease [Amorphus orientalis]MDQ0316337.1 general L-amino acid transport system permease protein [Amorphus orientalis]